jgi:hypothetical protein
MRTLFLAALGASLLLVVKPAAAQTIPSAFRYVETTHAVGLFAGYLQGRGSILVDTIAAEPGPRPAPLFGAHYTIRLGGPVSALAAASFSPSERAAYAMIPSAVGADSALSFVGTTPMPLLFTEAGIVFHLTGARTWRGLAPYLVGTGGVLWNLGGTTPEERQTEPTRRFDFGSRFTTGFGGGTEVFLQERLSLRVEGKGQFWQLPRPTAFRAAGQSGGEWRVSPLFTIGAALHF